MYIVNKSITTFDDISLFISMNLLMVIKKQCSCDYWWSASDLNDAYISRLMSVNRFGLI